MPYCCFDQGEELFQCRTCERSTVNFINDECAPESRITAAQSNLGLNELVVQSEGHICGHVECSQLASRQAVLINMIEL